MKSKICQSCGVTYIPIEQTPACRFVAKSEEILARSKELDVMDTKIPARGSLWIFGAGNLSVRAVIAALYAGYSSFLRFTLGKRFFKSL